MNPISSIRLPLLGVAAVLLVGSWLAAPALASDPGDSGDSTLASFRLGEELFTLHHAVAFETSALRSRPGEKITVVVLTRDPIDMDQVTASVEAKGNWTGSGHLRLTLRFDSDGSLYWGMFQGDSNNVQLDIERIEATVELEASNLTATLSQSTPSDFFGDEYLLEGASFDVPVLASKR